jgi:N-acetylglucosaminyldiphosphoundecaprenol N-acetyl-beta-D-mannosaminyltransferase
MARMQAGAATLRREEAGSDPALRRVSRPAEAPVAGPPTPNPARERKAIPAESLIDGARWWPNGGPEVFELDHALGATRAGMRFYTGEMEGLVSRLLDAPARGEMITVCNTHMLVAAGRDPALAGAMRGAAFSLCDGKPIAWLMGLLTRRPVARITGPDVLEIVLGAHLDHCRVALVGGDADVLERLRERVPAAARDNLLLLDPGQVVEGDGPSEEIFAALDAFAPRMVFVGLGCPKQEKWIARATSRVPAHFLGVGAAFDYGAGNIRRAPKAMQAAGAEWIYRATQQPRLIRRYLATLAPFLGILGLGAVRRLTPAPERRGRNLGV